MTQTNKKKRAVITGASSGIGRAVALELARFGFELLLCARNWEKLLETETEIRDDGGVAYAFACDVGVSEDVCKLVEEASKRWDSVDVLFNNAGIGKAVSIQETTDDDWAEMISGSLTGTFHCCRGFLPLLLNAEAPVIINNASVAAHRGFSDFLPHIVPPRAVSRLFPDLLERNCVRNRCGFRLSSRELRIVRFGMD